MTLTPLPAEKALDAYFLEARARLMDLAAILDRIDRGGTMNDPRVTRIQEALEVIGSNSVGRAARVQEVFSLPYEAAWKRPEPRS